MSTHTIQTTTSTMAVSKRGLHAALAALLGLVILFGVGFAPKDVIHNAAHDSRHGLSFPCH